MFAQFARLLGKNDKTAMRARNLLQQIISVSREPSFYTIGEIPDTIEGRFEAIILTGFPVFYCLKGQGEEADKFSQKLFDLMFHELDTGLRESGVGDLKVPRKVKQMAEGFYGRVVAYEKALEAGDREALEAAVLRNVYASVEGQPSAGAVAFVASALEIFYTKARAISIASIISGELPYDITALPKAA